MNTTTTCPKKQRTIEFSARTPEAIEEAAQILITYFKEEGVMSSSAAPLPTDHNPNITRREIIQRGEYGMRLIEMCTIGNHCPPPHHADYILRLDALY